jgi:methyltransferase
LKTNIKNVSKIYNDFLQIFSGFFANKKASKMAGKRANLNQFAHPKNPYKNGLGNLEDLVKNDSEFNQIAKRNPETGKVTTDWSDRQYVKDLMRAILRRDFSLDLKSPAGSLAPALTNKLNYLLWLEDLAALNSESSIQGIDIGTGAAMYFAAIAVKKLKWKMLATEANFEDFIMAKDNLLKNHLESDIILVHTADPTKIFPINATSEFEQYFFSMCNPPFYEKDAKKRRERSEFDGVKAGREHEIEFDGGEVEFVSKMILESVEIRDKVSVFTTLIGHKRNLAILKESLAKIGTIQATSVTEFCQGRTMRWGLAWTFNPKISLMIKDIRAEAKSLEKLKQPIEFQLDFKSAAVTCVQVSHSLKELFESISVVVAKEGKVTDNNCYMRLKTTKTNWRGQRAKRRQNERQPQAKRQRMDDNSGQEIEEDIKLDCQLYVQRKNNTIAFQFIFLSGQVGKNGLAELVQCVKNQLKKL